MNMVDFCCIRGVVMCAGCRGGDVYEDRRCGYWQFSRFFE